MALTGFEPVSWDHEPHELPVIRSRRQIYMFIVRILNMVVIYIFYRFVTFK